MTKPSCDSAFTCPNPSSYYLKRWCGLKNTAFFTGVAVRMILISIIAMTMWTEIIVWLLGCLFYCSSS